MTILAWTLIGSVIFIASNIASGMIGWQSGRANGMRFASVQLRTVHAYAAGIYRDGRIDFDHTDED